MPQLTVREDGGVLCGHLVSRKAFVVPLGHRRVIGQHGRWVQALCHGDQHLVKGKGVLHHECVTMSTAS